MRQYNTLRTQTRFAAFLILGFALVTFGCATNKASSSNAKANVQAEAVPEGICFTFDSIPPETIYLDFCIFEYGPPEALADFGEMDYAYSNITGNALEQVKQTGKVIFPYVKAGQKYFIAVYFYEGDGKDGIQLIEHPSIRMECTPYTGIYLTDDIELKLNETHTSVTLSAELIFPAEIEYDPDLPKFFYFYDIDWDEAALASVKAIEDWDPFMFGWYGHTNELSIDFSPLYGLRDYVGTGDYPAYFITYGNIMYNGVSWSVEIAKSGQFILSL
jgi:hypothetical protein